MLCNVVQCSTFQYIITKDWILTFNTCNVTSKRGVYFTLHSLGVYELIVNEIKEEIMSLMIVKWFTVRIRAQLGIYGQIYPFPFRSFLGLCPRELLQAKGFIWSYIPPLVLIRIQYNTAQYSTIQYNSVQCSSMHYENAELTKCCKSWDVSCSSHCSRPFLCHLNPLLLLHFKVKTILNLQ